MEALDSDIQALNASDKPASRRALVNASNQDIEPKSLESWLDRYQHDVLDVVAPGEPLVRNSFMRRQEGYKDTRWVAWQNQLEYDSWKETWIGTGRICEAIQPTMNDNLANWITKRFGGFDLKAKLANKKEGLERFERAAFGFYVGDRVAKDFFDECVHLLGRQFPVVSHLMFLKDRNAYVPVKPNAFEAGLGKLGIKFYLNGECSWDTYTKFLGYVERLRGKLQEAEPAVTLLDAHSILWIIGSGYWFEGEGAEKIEKVRRGELTPEQV